MFSRDNETVLDPSSHYCDRCGSPIRLGTRVEYEGKIVMELCSRCKKILKNQRTDPDSDIWIWKKGIIDE